MTGLDIQNLFNTYIDEIGTEFYDTVTLNNILLKASYNIIDKKIELFQSNNKITREVQSLITFTTVLAPVNATIDVSPTSTDVPEFYSITNALVTSPYRGASISKYSKERPYAQFQSDYTEGDARNPRYYFSNGLMTVEPADATGVKITYFKLPQTIDVENDTDEILYNDKILNLIIDEAMIIAGIKGRDQGIVQNESMMEQKNP